MEGEDSEERSQEGSRRWIDGSSPTGGARQRKGTELEGLGSAKHLSSDRRPGNPNGNRRGELSRRSGTEGIEIEIEIEDSLAAAEVVGGGRGGGGRKKFWKLVKHWR
jgi:hypothetical protein